MPVSIACNNILIIMIMWCSDCGLEGWLESWRWQALHGHLLSQQLGRIVCTKSLNSSPGITSSTHISSLCFYRRVREQLLEHEQWVCCDLGRAELSICYRMELHVYNTCIKIAPWLSQLHDYKLSLRYQQFDHSRTQTLCFSPPLYANLQRLNITVQNNYAGWHTGCILLYLYAVDRTCCNSYVEGFHVCNHSMNTSAFMDLPAKCWFFSMINSSLVLISQSWFLIIASLSWVTQTQPLSLHIWLDLRLYWYR